MRIRQWNSFLQIFDAMNMEVSITAAYNEAEEELP